MAEIFNIQAPPRSRTIEMSTIPVCEHTQCDIYRRLISAVTSGGSLSDAEQINSTHSQRVSASNCLLYCLKLGLFPARFPCQRQMEISKRYVHGLRPCHSKSLIPREVCFLYKNALFFLLHLRLSRYTYVFALTRVERKIKVLHRETCQQSAGYILNDTT